MKTIVVAMFVLLIAAPPSAEAGPLAYGICQTGCNTVWVACVAAGGTNLFLFF